MQTIQIVKQTDMTNYELVESNGCGIGYYTQKDPEKTGPNEDSLGFFLFNNTAVLAVADGVGGSPKGEEASQLAIEKVIKPLKQNEADNKKTDDLRNRVLNGIEKANEAIINSNKGMRTTLTVCEIERKSLRCYQIGDSCLVVCGQKGLLKYKTTEHSPVGFALQSGMLNEKKALKHPERNIVSNVMGDSDMYIEIGPVIELSPRDTILVASDGLFDNFYLDEIIEVIRKESITDVMSKLVEMCQPMRQEKERSSYLKPDDISFILYRNNQ